MHTPKFATPELFADWLHDFAADIGYPWPADPPVDDEHEMWRILDEIRAYVLFVYRNAAHEPFPKLSRQAREALH